MKNVRILLIWNLGTNFIEILIKMHAFSFKKMNLKCRLRNDGHLAPAPMGRSVSSRKANSHLLCIVAVDLLAQGTGAPKGTLLNKVSWKIYFCRTWILIEILNMLDYMLIFPRCIINHFNSFWAPVQAYEIIYSVGTISKLDVSDMSRCRTETILEIINNNSAFAAIFKHWGGLCNFHPITMTP